MVLKCPKYRCPGLLQQSKPVSWDVGEPTTDSSVGLEFECPVCHTKVVFDLKVAVIWK